ncbi:unnamed protein product [Lathyrus oleraceus]
MASTKKINLKSCDGDIFEIDEAVALESQTIKHMIEDNCADATGIPLPNVTSKTLAKVIEYCKKHVEAANSQEKRVVEAANSQEKRAVEAGNSQEKHAVEAGNSQEKHVVEDNLKNWDAEFVKVNQVTLFELILAANYLDIKSLLDLTSKAIAAMMVGKTPEEIRKMFNIANDFTEEEEEELREENKWAFE